MAYTQDQADAAPFIYQLQGGNALGSLFFDDAKLEAQKYVSVQGHALMMAMYDLRQRAIRQGCQGQTLAKGAAYNSSGTLTSCPSTLTTWLKNFTTFEGRVVAVGLNFDKLNRFAKVEAAPQYKPIVQDLKNQYEALRKSFEQITNEKGLALPGEPESSSSGLFHTLVTVAILGVGGYIGWQLLQSSRLSRTETPRYAGGYRRAAARR